MMPLNRIFRKWRIKIYGFAGNDQSPNVHGRHQTTKRKKKWKP